MSVEPELVESRVKEIIAEQLGIMTDEVRPDHTFTDDLGADKLDFLELIMACEEEFELDIDEETAEALETVQDLTNFIGSSMIKG